MTKKSSIQKLPTEVRDFLNQLLRDNQHTQLDITDQINEQLSQLDLQPVSKSAVNRYSMKMAEVGKKIQQTREISQMWIDKLGSSPGGQVGHLLNEIVRTMAFDMTTNLADGDITPELISQLALAVQRLEQASAESEKRERQIKEAVKKEAMQKVETTAKNKGLSKLTIAQIKEAMQ